MQSITIFLFHIGVLFLRFRCVPCIFHEAAYCLGRKASSEAKGEAQGPGRRSFQRFMLLASGSTSALDALYYAAQAIGAPLVGLDSLLPREATRDSATSVLRNVQSMGTSDSSFTTTGPRASCVSGTTAN